MSENNITKKPPFLEVRDLTVEYTSGGEVIHAVNGVSFSLEKGKTLGLVGETGAGKTTIAKSILRILPDRSASIRGGEINIDGENLLALKEPEMRKIRGKKISMVFQDPMTALNPVQRVGQQIAEVIKNHGSVRDKATLEKKAKEMLELVGIPADRYYEYPHQFSGGMKQRVVIAIALACNPDLLLADEPTTALDVTIQAQVLDLIENLKRERKTAMVMITHDLGVVATVCDEVAVIYAGSIVEYGTKEQIFDHPTHPYTIGLFASIPDISTDREWLYHIEGLPPDPANLPEGCSFNPRCPYACDSCRQGVVDLHQTPDGHVCRCINIQKVLDKGVMV